jgi:tetratricopeptide (TPR) repeat protein
MPAFFPKFRITHDDKIYTIGSCFARNIEKVLVANGYDVVTNKLPIDDPAFEKLGTELLNNYGVTSILNEFEWALDPERPFDVGNNTLEVARGRYVDLHLVPSIRANSLEAVVARREAIIAVTRQIVDCRIVIITLGLSEVWYDSYTSTYLNYAIPRTAIAKSPDRYELHVLSYEETIGCLRRIMALLAKYCRKDQRVLLTVSPVPLSTTHTTDDVIVANCYSKSALRTAAGTIAAEYPNVDYFPSYESVIYSDRLRAFKDDHAHVQGEIVELNVGRMLAAYGADAEPLEAEPEEEPVHDPAASADIAGIMGEARKRMREANYRAVLKLTDSLLNSEARFAAQQLRAGAFSKLAQWPEAEAAYREVLASDTGNPSIYGHLGRILSIQNRNNEAIVLLEKACTLAPTASNWPQQLATVMIAVGRIDDAAKIVESWLEREPDNQRLIGLRDRIAQLMARFHAREPAAPATPPEPVREAPPTVTRTRTVREAIAETLGALRAER